ncbi:riboflavin biosynthesis protein RibD [Legionella jordanis]|uniref:Riboflavin biosynthesis protein RibD n=2 Tax=Legionella jordanis TaxID=456 RepID=A0A0W0V9Y7_9GAMM|nr:riboflavin biosynthesis protein RibD [Legionella jordanis]VEH12851.1 riboflavin biosynthesis protein [Legionella jordanis]
MLAALEQAWLGRGLCAPNPSVGAVAVRSGKIIARAWHQGAGKAHAEQLLLQQIPKGLDDISLYVTLEPCNHWGKTPPCASAIIEHGISKVIFGFCDPNPIVAANDTPKILEQAGIEVLHFPLQEIDSFYQSYRYWIMTKKPWITVKLAQTFDGKIAGEQGAPCHLSNAACKTFTHLNRKHTDLILTTAKTIAADNPMLNVRLQDEEFGKPLAILDRRLLLSPEARALKNARHCHIFHDEGHSAEESLPNCSYHGIPSINNRLDLEAIIKHIGAMGYHDVWVEAGGELFSALHQRNLVQRTFLYLVPEILGEKTTPAFHGNALFARNKTVSWQIKEDNAIACLDWEV